MKKILIATILLFNAFWGISQTTELSELYREKCASFSLKFPKCSDKGGQPITKFGNYYGNCIDDEQWVLDGQYVSAANNDVEERIKNDAHFKYSVKSASELVKSKGFNLDDEFLGKEYLYIHAAQVLLDFDKAKSFEVAKQNTIAGCILQAIGVKALIDEGMTRAALIKCVSKLAKRCLGWFGAAVACIDFIECYFTD